MQQVEDKKECKEEENISPTKQHKSTYVLAITTINVNYLNSQFKRRTFRLD